MEVMVDNIVIGANGKESKYNIRNFTPSKKDIFEMTSKVNRDVAKYIIEMYNSGRETSDEVLDNLLEIWAKRKYPLYVLFGRKLSVSFKCLTSLTVKKYMEELQDICKKQNITRKKGNEEVFIDTSHFIYYLPIIQLFDEEDFKRNICKKDDIICELIDTYKPGQKLSRFFSNFFNDPEFDIELSKVLQDRDMDTYANISIDFNDFLTSSFNGNGWTTCFSLHGCHESSIPNILFDRSTAVAFFSQKNFQFGKNLVWNSKELRCFVHVDLKTSSFCISRAYPNVDNNVFYDNIKYGMEEIISSYFQTEEDWKVDLVTPNMDKGSCCDTYTISQNNLYRIHKNVLKRYLTCKSKQYFLDPIKYICSLEGFISKEILVGESSYICMCCGKISKEPLVQGFMCKECYDC